VVSVLVEQEDVVVVEEVKQRDMRWTCVNPVERLERHIWQMPRTNV
jgi:hypothetical protein